MSSPISRSASVTPKVDNISGSWFTENFNDFSDAFLDGLGDMKYYDFGLEDVEPNDAGEDWKNEFQNIEPPPFSFLAGFPSSGFENGKNDLKVEKNSVVSCDATLQLKQWPATEDLRRKYPSLHDSSDGKYLHSLRTCSPVSVLESSSTSSSSSAEILMTCFPKNGVPVKRPRSKLFYTPRRTFPTIAVPNSSRRHRCLTKSKLDGFYAGDMAFDAAKKSHKKKKNLTQISSVMEIIEPCSDSGETRRCTHCQVSKTPQWREGPMGPKTLCNACGVRYRSGRLFPEYRPAASPTFVPSVHSNSHRKVLEMRKKSGRPSASAVMASPAASAAEYSF